MTDPTTPRGPASGFWMSPKLSWALVFVGLLLFHLLRIPSLPTQLAQCREGMTADNLLLLGYLFAISVVPITGLWRLSPQAGLPRALSFLFLLFPIAIVGVYLVWPFLRRARSGQ